MPDFTFEKLPEAVSQIYTKLENIERLLILNSSETQAKIDRWLDLNELVDYDPEKRSKSTFYGYISDRKIPFHKRGKKVLFLKSEIDEWLRAGRKLTISEIEDETMKTIKIGRAKK